ncbi:MAG: PAS domain S-box protein [Phycisphaerales bacterium]|nr:MAG: PAS domain S-box protein [Phycisphaerales bacterium]
MSVKSNDTGPKTCRPHAHSPEQATIPDEVEQRFTAAFEQSAVGMAHMHATGRFIRVNRKLCDMLGYSHEELITKTFPEVTHPDDLELDLQLTGQVIAGEIPHYTIEKRYIRRDGSPIWSSLTITPVRDAAGETQYYSAVMVDISHQKAMEIALQEGEERFRLAVKATRDAMWDCDLARNRVWWSDAYEGRFGTPPTDTKGCWRWWLNHIAPDDRDRAAESLKSTLRGGGEFWEAEYSYRIIDGSFIPVQDRALIARDASGAPIRILGTIRDLTKRKLAESKLREADRMAAIGNVAAGLAHDMGNVLLPMRSALDRLLHVNMEPRIIDSLELLRACTKSLASLTDGVRRIARSDSQSTPRIVDLAKWWNDTMPLYRAAMPPGVVLEGEIAEALPPIKVNEDHLTRAVLNMVVNAAEAIVGLEMEPGTVVVWVQPDAIASQILLGVRDNGPGIPAEIRERVFEPFFSTKKHGLSTGMGMSVVRSFAMEVDGLVEVISEPGEGANIILHLPTAPREQLLQVAHTRNDCSRWD